MKLSKNSEKVLNLFSEYCNDPIKRKEIYLLLAEIQSDEYWAGREYDGDKTLKRVKFNDGTWGFIYCPYIPEIIKHEKES